MLPRLVSIAIWLEFAYLPHLGLYLNPQGPSEKIHKSLLRCCHFQKPQRPVSVIFDIMSSCNIYFKLLVFFPWVDDILFTILITLLVFD